MPDIGQHILHTPLLIAAFLQGRCYYYYYPSYFTDKETGLDALGNLVNVTVCQLG